MAYSKILQLSLLLIGGWSMGHANAADKTLMTAAEDSSHCSVVCKAGKSSPRCMKLSKADGRGGAFNAVYTKMVADTGKIEAAWLQSQFEVTEDPCNRLDSVRTDAIWENIGLNCRIATSISIFNNKQLVLSIEAPRRIAFRRAIVGETLLLKPASPMAEVKFTDNDLNKDWGGGILGVTATPSVVQFQMPKGCIQIPTK